MPFGRLGKAGAHAESKREKGWARHLQNVTVRMVCEVARAVMPNCLNDGRNPFGIETSLAEDRRTQWALLSSPLPLLRLRIVTTCS